MLPQVRILADAAYGADEGERLCRDAPYLDPQSVMDMLKGAQPRVLVIVNKARSLWNSDLSTVGASIAVVEVLRSRSNQYIFRVNGQHPTPPADTVSTCQLDAILSSMLAIASPAGLGVPPNSVASLRFEDGVTEWRRMDVADKVWLVPLSANPLEAGVPYAILRHEDGGLEIVRDVTSGG